MTHGDMSERIGITRAQWEKTSHTGFIYKDNLPEIKKHPLGLSGWIANRHRKAGTNYITDRDHGSDDSEFSDTLPYRTQKKQVAENVDRKYITQTNSTANIKSLLKNSKYGELRYLKHRDKVHVMDAVRGIHQDLGDALGLTQNEIENQSHCGYIKPENVKEIGSHPRGVSGWIADRHKKQNSMYYPPYENPSPGIKYLTQYPDRPKKVAESVIGNSIGAGACAGVSDSDFTFVVDDDDSDTYQQRNQDDFNTKSDLLNTHLQRFHYDMHTIVVPKQREIKSLREWNNGFKR